MGSSSLAAWGALTAAVGALLLFASVAYIVWADPGPQGSPTLRAPTPARSSSSRAPHKIQRSFRNKQFDSGVFAWVGTRPEKFARREDEGLRITFSEHDRVPQPVGVKLRYPVRGDFDLEVTLELLHIDPPKFFASGVNVYLLLDSPDREGIWLGKMKIIEKGLCFFAGSNASQEKVRGQKYHQDQPTDQETGLARLRIVREGARFLLYGAEGASSMFQLVDSIEISAADVLLVRFALEPGRRIPTGVDARLVDFSMTAQEFVGLWQPQP
jgi:hypothetical protein